MKFNSKLFSQLVVYLAKNAKKLNGEYYRTRKELYQILGTACCTEPETVRSWTRPGRAPNPTSLVRLENLLQVKPGFFEIGDDEVLSTMENYAIKKEEVKMISDFTKNKIFELNTLLREYFQDMDTTDDRLYALSLQVDDLRITVPKKIYDETELFIRQDLADFVSDDGEGSDEEAYYERLKKLFALADRWEDIATQSLMPYMI